MPSDVRTLAPSWDISVGRLLYMYRTVLESLQQVKGLEYSLEWYNLVAGLFDERKCFRGVDMSPGGMAWALGAGVSVNNEK